MVIKAINTVEKDGLVTGVFDYRSLGGEVGKITIDLNTVRTAKNYSEFSEKINLLLEKAKGIFGVVDAFEDFEKKIKIFGKEVIEDSAVTQLENCLSSPEDIGVLTADAHYGYSHPIGGAIAYKNKVSLSGVGFDIACGNKAVMTNINASDVNIKKVMDQIMRDIGFGTGRPNPKPIDHEILERISQAEFEPQRKMAKMASEQLGTVGSGNHFVDLLKDENGKLWIGVHFGSRGFGHKTTTGFIALAKGLSWDARIDEKKDIRPILFDTNSALGQAYLKSLELAGDYAYAGRDVVVDKVLEILGGKALYGVHNHHNFAWKETHFGEEYWVVRKGCTPAFPGQQGFIGATMRDVSVIVEGVDTPESRAGLFSTVHGAGRVLSRTKATGKGKWQKVGRNKRKNVIHTPGVVDWPKVKAEMKSRGIVLVGAGADEAPECYKSLEEVLEYQGNTIKVLHRLAPIGVAMAPSDVIDPYKD